MAKYSDFIGRLYQRAFELALNAPPGALSHPEDLSPPVETKNLRQSSTRRIRRLFPEGEEGAKTSNKPLTKEDLEAMFKAPGENDRDR